MKKLKSKWKIEPGDGSGMSIADALVRNSNGLCAIMNCGKPMNCKNEYTIFGGILCNDCHKDWKFSVEESLKGWNE
jgi:hypothetical protein